MLAIEGDFVVGFNIYKYKEALKSYHCRWNPDVKKWTIPNNPDGLKIFINSVNEDEKKEMEDNWKKALLKCGYGRVKKGTPQYDEVKAAMLNLLKNV